MRGVSRSSRTSVSECGGRGSVGREAVMTGRTFNGLVSQPARRRTALLPSSPMLRRMGTKPAKPLGEDGSRTVKPCGPGTRCWCQVRGGEVGLNRVRSAANLRMTVTRGIRRRGERGVNRSNHCAGKAGLSRPNLWSLPRALFSHGGPRVRRAPGLPCALCFQRSTRRQSPGRDVRGGNVQLYLLLEN